MTNISIRNLARLMQAYKIRFTTLDRAFLKEAARAFDVRTGRKRGRATVAMYLGDIKRAMPDVEFYIDEAGRTLVHPSPEILAALINDAIIHEDCHAEGLNERQTRAAVKALGSLLKPMTQMLVKCPKDRNVTFEECFECKSKDSTCPPLAIRKSQKPRKYVPGVYHVTELVHPRRSYFNRLIAITKGWDSNDYMDFVIGTAVHRFIQRNFKFGESEIGVFHDFSDGFSITGSIDAISDGVLYDFKSTTSLYYRIKENAPDPDHVFQTRAYYSLLKRQNPGLASRIKRIRIVYLGKKPERVKIEALVREARSLIKNPTSAKRIREIVDKIEKIKSARLTRYKEFDFEPEDITAELVKRGRTMHESFKSLTPPADLCPAWLCGYCDYVRPCAGDYGNYVKDFATFKRLLDQGRRGLEKVAGHLESEGHRVLVDPIAATCQIFLNPRNKPRGKPDMIDVTAGEVIDVKTTSNTDAFWINEKHLEPAVERGWIFYIILGNGEVRKIAARSLMDKIKSAKVEKRYFKYGSERGFLFKKDVAEVVR